MDSFSEIWELIKEYLKNSVTEVAYNVWLKPLEFVSFKNDTITLSISEFKRGIVVDKFSSLIEEACEATIGFPVKIEFSVIGNSSSPVAAQQDNKDKIISHEYDYTFDNFIIGPSNRFAHGG
ncbi:MAG: hypothetical protein NC110_01325, partial [Ruminococcus sp.]|nr:hypothetical protein [Ruminococcus sp.]